MTPSCTPKHGKEKLRGDYSEKPAKQRIMQKQKETKNKKEAAWLLELVSVDWTVSAMTITIAPVMLQRPHNFKT